MDYLSSGICDRQLLPNPGDSCKHVLDVGIFRSLHQHQLPDKERIKELQEQPTLVCTLKFNLDLLFTWGVFQIIKMI